MTYFIETLETHTVRCSYTVEASSPEEAVSKIKAWEVEYRRHEHTEDGDEILAIEFIVSNEGEDFSVDKFNEALDD